MVVRISQNRRKITDRISVICPHHGKRLTLGKMVSVGNVCVMDGKMP
jgi:hypothetical protein